MHEIVVWVGGQTIQLVLKAKHEYLNFKPCGRLKILLRRPIDPDPLNDRVPKHVLRKWFFQRLKEVRGRISPLSLRINIFLGHNVIKARLAKERAPPSPYTDFPPSGHGLRNFRLESKNEKKISQGLAPCTQLAVSSFITRAAFAQVTRGHVGPWASSLCALSSPRFVYTHIDTLHVDRSIRLQ